MQYPFGDKNMMMKIVELKVNDKYKNLIPRPTKKQYEILKNDINENDIEFPLVINGKKEILDGYTRFNYFHKCHLFQ